MNYELDVRNTRVPIAIQFPLGVSIYSIGRNFTQRVNYEVDVENSRGPIAIKFWEREWKLLAEIYTLLLRRFVVEY